jgi:hypothetical protein
MKLIRLTTENENALFDNNFNEDIIVKPNSRICLQSLATQINKDILQINAQNNEISFTVDGGAIGDGSFKTIYLEHATYDSSTINDFLTDFTTKLNLAMDGETGASLGKQWRVALKGNRVEIQCIRGAVLTLFSQPITNKFLRFNNAQIQPPQDANAYIEREGGTINTNDSNFFSLQPCNKGASSLRCQLREDTETNSGFKLCYINTLPTGSASIPNTSLMYAIVYRNESTAYEVWYNETQVPLSDVAQVFPSILAPADPENDILCIDIAEELVSFYIQRGEDKLLLYEHADDVDVPYLFAAGVMVGNTQVWNLQNTTDPYYVIDDTIIRYNKSPLTPAFGVPIPTNEFKSNTYFSFGSNDLAIALGFKQDTFPLLQPSYPILTYTLQDNISLLADYPFFLKFNADSYIVELLNIKINSMDAMTNQHKNFLAVIPHSDIIEERVTYLAPVLLWIDLNNKEPLNLRQIKARIIQQDLSPIFCYGTSQLVLLIE